MHLLTEICSGYIIFVGIEIMPYSVEYDKKTDCIYVSVEGEFNLSSFNSMAADVAQCLSECGCRRILNDLRHARLMGSIVDIYSMPERAMKVGITRAVKRALVISGTFSRFHFLETVFINQGNIVRLFNSIDDAKRWLFDKD